MLNHEIGMCKGRLCRFLSTPWTKSLSWQAVEKEVFHKVEWLVPWVMVWVAWVPWATFGAPCLDFKEVGDHPQARFFEAGIFLLCHAVCYPPAMIWKPNFLCKAHCKQLQMESNRRCAPFLNLEDFVLKASTCLGSFVGSWSIWKKCQHSTEGLASLPIKSTGSFQPQRADCSTSPVLYVHH